MYTGYRPIYDQYLRSAAEENGTPPKKKKKTQKN